jgi:hypothetical protein
VPDGDALLRADELRERCERAFGLTQRQPSDPAPLRRDARPDSATGSSSGASEDQRIDNLQHAFASLLRATLWISSQTHDLTPRSVLIGAHPPKQ